jgi:hypothetical protein
MLAAALALLAGSAAQATEAGWATSSDYVNMGDVFGQRWLATEADASGTFRLSYACDEIHGESYFILETPLPRLPVEVTTIPVRVRVDDVSLDFSGHTQVHGNIFYDGLRIGLYQYQQIETFAELAGALRGGEAEIAVTILDRSVAFSSEHAAAGIAHVDRNCR